MSTKPRRSTPRATFDSFLDFLESRPFPLVATVLFTAVTAWLLHRYYSVDGRVARVCNGLYRNARTAAESTAIDTSRTAVRALDNTVVISERCGQLQITDRLG